VTIIDGAGAVVVTVDVAGNRRPGLEAVDVVAHLLLVASRLGGRAVFSDC
jgi:hypothetical protein